MKHNIEKIDLSCGAKLLLINVPNAGSVYFTTNIRGGYWYLPKAKYELPHLLEHLVFTGNKEYPSQFKFMYEIEKNGAYRNASTNCLKTDYIFYCGKKELDSITELAITQIKSPLFRESDIKSEKKVIEKELSNYLEKDDRRCSYKNSQTIATNTQDYPHRIKSLEKITREDILNFHKQYFTAKNTYFVISGDINEQTKKKLVERLETGLKNYPIGQTVKIKKAKMGKYQRTISVLNTKITTQAHFYITFVKPFYEDEDREIFSIINTIYNRGSASRLFQKTRKEGLSYSVGSKFNVNPLDYYEFYIKSQTIPEKLHRLFEVCMEELANICNDHYTRDEFERAKGYVLGNHERYFESSYRFGNWYRYDFIMGMPLETPESYRKKLKEVTRKDIARVCKKYFTKDNWCLTLVGQNIDEDKYRKVLDKYFK